MVDHVNPVAQLRNVSHTYKAVHALSDITIDIPQSQIVGLIGPDGVGKSTLLGLISGARRLQDGILQVLGGNIATARHLRRVGPRIAYMPQGLGKNLYQELSVFENLDFFGKLFNQGPAERKSRIDLLTQATGLFPFRDRPAGKLSGGMKQKLGLCCALIHDPDLLILDEPTTGVDPLSRRQFWELIDTIRTERPELSVLVSTAYMDEAEGFDWLVAMNEGRILDTGTPAQLKQKTRTRDLERAFVSLLPDEKRKSKRELTILPRQKSDGKPAIVANGLTRRFGDFTAVDQVSFEIEEGEIFGFLGSNGCGKSTTMKMLTGLLPASEGEAYLFGMPVNANDPEIRKRVGFMSQSFSLYSELTVRKNLELHAHLFNLGPQKTAERIATLTHRFNLGSYMDAFASSLPLGIRQRLSLAVAIIHEPEMLILDEPTSGVDPVARDEFWEFLIELSRRDKVTIFISTHFMNEAYRCDRISLMHAGQVLVYDQPEDLVKSKDAETLEEAFILYIEDAIGEPSDLVDSENFEFSHIKLSAPVAPGSDRGDLLGFNFNRLLAYSYRETMEVIRDPVRLAFAFVGSSILLIIIAYGISTDVDNLTYAALDRDRTPQSREYLRNFSGSQYFIEKPDIENKQELENRLKSNDITLGIEIPPGFGRDIKKGGKPQISAWIDGANTMRAGTIEGYVSGGHTLYLTRLAREAGLNVGDPSATIEPRFRYNPSFESIYAIGPSTPALLLLMFPAILMAVSIAREKEIGTIINFYVTPSNRYEFLIGKQLPYIAIGMANFIILTLIVLLLFQVPFKGSFLALSLGALLYVIASTGFGLLVSSVTKSQVAAVFATAILSMLPTMQFSGFIQPVSTLEGGGRFIGSMWPTTYYIHMSVGAFTKGLNLSDLLPDLIALTAFAPVFIVITALFLKKQEA